MVKLVVIKTAIAWPLKIACFANGKNEIVTNKNSPACLTNFEMISTGVVNL